VGRAFPRRPAEIVHLDIKNPGKVNRIGYWIGCDRTRQSNACGAEGTWASSDRPFAWPIKKLGRTKASILPVHRSLPANVGLGILGGDS
jgi:hypothetical protein